MAFRSDGDILEGVQAGADLSGKERLCCVFNGSGKVVLAGLNAQVLGVLTLGAVADQAVGVQVGGRVIAIAGAAVAAGSPVKSDAAGKVVVAAPTEKAFGWAMSAATALDQEMTVHLARFVA